MLFFLVSLLLPASPLHARTDIRADFDASGAVDFPDFLAFAGTYNRSDADPAFYPRADLDDNGAIDFADWLLFAEDYGRTSPVDVGNDIGNGYDVIHGPDGPEGADRDNPFRSLSVHPDRPNTVLMGTERNGFVRSVDGGHTWTRHRLGLRHQGGYPEVWDIARHPDDPEAVLAATLDSPGPVTGSWPSSTAGVYRSEDGGATWTRANQGLTSSRITSVAFSRGDTTRAVIGVEGGEVSFDALAGRYFGGGLYYTSDNGRVWSRAAVAGADSTNGYWRIVERQGTLVTFGLNLIDPDRNEGFLRSTDGGRTWDAFAPGLRSLRITEFDVGAEGRRIVAHERDSFVLRISDDAGETWRVTDINQANGPVAVSPADPDRIVFVTNQRTLVLSTDGAASQTDVLTTDATITDIAFAPSDPAVVYATGEGYVVYRSDDAGASFTQVADIRKEVLGIDDGKKEDGKM